MPFCTFTSNVWVLTFPYLNDKVYCQALKFSFFFAIDIFYKWNKIYFHRFNSHFYIFWWIIIYVFCPFFLNQVFVIISNIWGNRLRKKKKPRVIHAGNCWSWNWILMVKEKASHKKKFLWANSSKLLLFLLSRLDSPNFLPQ